MFHNIISILYLVGVIIDAWSVIYWILYFNNKVEFSSTNIIVTLIGVGLTFLYLNPVVRQKWHGFIKETIVDVFK